MINNIPSTVTYADAESWSRDVLAIHVYNPLSL